MFMAQNEGVRFFLEVYQHAIRGIWDYLPD